MEHKLHTDIIPIILRAKDQALHEIMDAFSQRYKIVFPDLDVIYPALYKAPQFRKTEILGMMEFLQKELYRCMECTKHSSLG